MSTDRRRGHGRPPSARRDRDEDLILFKEMFKHEKERNVSLLQPVSDEFEPNQGNYPLYKIAPGKKGADFLVADGKNDYDWLKTPPATPLFPSLDLEADDPLLNMAVHKELPILQPIKPSRFSSNSERTKPSQRTKSPSPTSAASSSSSTSVTPRLKPQSPAGGRTTHIPTSLINNHQRIKPIPVITATSNPNSNSKLRSRALGIPPSLPEFTDDTPRNLIVKTEMIEKRSSSTMRGRMAVTAAMAAEEKQESGRVNNRRVSCSPSTMRGRGTMELGGGKEKSTGGDGRVVVGSRMVERMMNARRTMAAGDEKPATPVRAAAAGEYEGTGFGRFMKNLDEKKNQSEGKVRSVIRLRSSMPTTDNVLGRETIRDEKKNQINESEGETRPMIRLRSSTPTTTNNRESPRLSTPEFETRVLRGRLNGETKTIVKKGTNSRNRCGLC
ncbi:hypothetical protein J5N97_022233 [Dioscorea zingiberensis]|uniref:Uncharacterized protein n=1 Tax=Dioscorea zingiberensis TaxID=325984 RepID=A0A9D5CA63_9LILI|nr:hypothetical protein J5N97_022233 [Dioscorea zingiberensis]